MNADDYARRYQQALADYLRGENDELALSQAYELGRGALADKLSILDLVGIHYQAVRALVAEGSSRAASAAGVRKVEAFLSEAVVLFEMTHRQAIERTHALQDSERRKAAVIDNAFDAVITMNQDGRIIEFNPAAEHIFGYARQQALGAELAELIIPLRLRQAHRRGLARYVETGEARLLGRRIEFPAQRADGAEFPAEIAVAAVRIDEALLFTAYVRDITERKQAEAERDRFNAELERRVAERTAELQAANRELDAFSYSVSHDLRAPLRAVKGFSTILIGDFAPGLPAEAANYLDLMRTNVNQMDQLVNGLLELSRFSRQPIRKTEVDVAQLVRECLAVLRPAADGQEVEVVIGELGTCRADRELLRQVFMNLLGNALKYSRRRKPARVEVGAQSDGPEYLAWVKDNGVGFDMRHADKLFGVFQRLHRAEDFEGTGVGLAIVARIVAKHGGRVWAESAPDQGATFHLALPTADEPPAESG